MPADHVYRYRSRARSRSFVWEPALAPTRLAVVPRSIRSSSFELQLVLFFEWFAPNGGYSPSLPTA